MKNILVPTDFSSTSKNAALYAIQLAQQLEVPKVILYHAYEISLVIDSPVPDVELLDEKFLKKESIDQLEELKHFLQSVSPKALTIETCAEYGNLNSGLDTACAATGSGLIVMGVTGGGLIKEKLIGSNAIAVAKYSKVQVIVVPPHAGFTKINDVLLLTDFKNSDTTIPDAFIKGLIHNTKAKLYVLHIEEGGRHPERMQPSGVTGESYALYKLLKDIHPEYHFIKSEGFVETVNDFAKKHMIDLIITAPRKHSFFETLFAPTHTKRLAFHSSIPVAIVRRSLTKR